MSAEAMSFETRQSPWWLVLISGILSVIIGILLLTTPARTVYTLVLALGFYWIFSGIFTLVAMFMDHTGWGWKLFSGLLSIIAGVVILRYPLMSAVTVPSIMVLLLGIQGIIVGILGLIMAFKGGGWGAGILAALSLIFGAILMANFANPAMVITLVWVTAFFALAGGIVQIIQAFRSK